MPEILLFFLVMFYLSMNCQPDKLIHEISTFIVQQSYVILSSSNRNIIDTSPQGWQANWLCPLRTVREPLPSCCRQALSHKENQVGHFWLSHCLDLRFKETFIHKSPQMGQHPLRGTQNNVFKKSPGENLILTVGKCM